MMSRFNTPLRYPGGKQRLAPFVREVIEKNGLAGCDYVEPYAGGAGVAIELLVRGVVERVHLNDVSRPLYAFWRAVLNQNAELCRRVKSASLTIEEWQRQRTVLQQASRHSQIDVAFSFLYLNRCNRSGILSAGVIGGFAQTGTWLMDARFPRNELVRRIEVIGALRSRIKVTCMDAEDYLTSYTPTLPKTTLIYCDPPYFTRADRLYLNHYGPADHERLADIIQDRVQHPWIVSYDAVPEIIKLYRKRRSFQYSLQYTAAKAYKGTELFVFSKGMRLPKTSEIESIDRALALV